MRALLTGIVPDQARALNRQPSHFLRTDIALQTIKTVSDYHRELSSISNTGNYFIGEAGVRLLRGEDGAFMPAWDLARQLSKKSFRDFIQKRFDCIVLLTANLIRKNYSAEFEFDILKKSGLFPVVVGVGIQNEFELERDIPKGTSHLIEFLRDMDSIVLTRGHTTSRYLRSKGVLRATATGCPSLYLKPAAVIESIRSLGSLKLSDGSTLAFSGYYPAEKYAVKEQNQYIRHGLKPLYIMQDELLSYGLEMPEFNYNDVNGQVTFQDQSSAVSHLLMPISFHHFFSTDQMRTWLSATVDVCVTRRFHGAVAAMQAGVPTICIARDDRMRELCEVSGVPSMDTRLFDADREGYSRADEIERFLDAFDAEAAVQRYAAAFRSFHSAVSDAGLINDAVLSVDEVLAAASSG